MSLKKYTIGYKSISLEERPKIMGFIESHAFTSSQNINEEYYECFFDSSVDPRVFEELKHCDIQGPL